MQENVKSVLRLDDAAIAAFKEKYAEVPEPWPAELRKKVRAEAKALIPSRRERRAKWRMQVKKSRLPWAFSSLGRPTHRLEPEKGKQYAPAIPSSVSDFEAIALADIKRAIRRRKWAYHVNRSR